MIKNVHLVLVNIKFYFFCSLNLFLFIQDLREYTSDFKDIEDDWKNAENVCKIFFFQIFLLINLRKYLDA